MANLSTYYPLPIVAGTTAGTFADGASAAHVGLANTFSANQTLNGTNNVAPNQTAASGSSIMTRELTDFRYVNPLRSLTYAFAAGWDQTVTTGGSINQRMNALQVNSSSGTTAGTAVASINGDRSRIANTTTTNFSGVNFANPLAINIQIGSRIWTNADCKWACLFGAVESLAASFAGMVAAGTSSARGWVGLQCVGGDIKIIAVNGTSAVAESSVIDTWSDGANTKAYALVVSNGAIAAYDAGGSLLGTLSSNVPTSEKSSHNIALLAEATSTTTTQNGIIIQHLSYKW